MATSAPPQTRGFLFADLRDYSRFAERHGDDAAANLLARYRALVREVIGRFDGAEIRTEGDSFYVVFSSVGSAVRAGLAILEGADRASSESAAEPIRVGIGIHAGETTDGEQGIVSSAVNIAARVCSVAGPGELLVTDTVRYLVRGYLQVGFTAAGSRKLKGISEPVSLYRVGPSAAAPDRRTIRSTMPHAWLRRGAIAIAAALVVAAIAIIGGTLVREGVARQDPSAPAQPASVASPSTDPSPSTAGGGEGASPTASGIASFPTEAEAAVMDRLRGDASGCVRADADEIPRVPDYYSPALRPMALSAGIRCLGTPARGDPAEILYFTPAPEVRTEDQLGHGTSTGDSRTGGPAEVDSAFLSLVGRLGLSASGCAEGRPGSDEWSFGGATGRILCYLNTEGRAALVWTVDDERDPVLARAVARDDDLSQLYTWWRDIGRLSVGE